MPFIKTGTSHPTRRYEPVTIEGTIPLVELVFAPGRRHDDTNSVVVVSIDGSLFSKEIDEGTKLDKGVVVTMYSSQTNEFARVTII